MSLRQVFSTAVGVAYVIFVAYELPSMLRRDTDFYCEVAKIFAPVWPLKRGLLPTLRALPYIWLLGLVVIALAIVPGDSPAVRPLAYAFLALLALWLAAALGRPRWLVPAAVRNVRDVSVLLAGKPFYK